MKKIAVVGMGLIGGSFFKASVKAGYECAGLHHSDTEGFSDADLVLVCLPPDAVAPWILKNAGSFKDGSLVVDIAGVKRSVLKSLSDTGGLRWKFVGGHPMAGREVSGYENSLATLFEGATMILTPPPGVTEGDIRRLERYFSSVGFARTIVTDASRHDEMIAFTSQLCHIIATAYARDVLVKDAAGFSAGSYANMTRIATQDDGMWSLLYRENSDKLLPVLDRFISRLGEFRSALAAGDRDAVRRFISEGAAAKREELVNLRRGDENV